MADVDRDSPPLGNAIYMCWLLPAVGPFLAGPQISGRFGSPVRTGRRKSATAPPYPWQIRPLFAPHHQRADGAVHGEQRYDKKRTRSRPNDDIEDQGFVILLMSAI